MACPYHLGIGAPTLAEGHSVRIHLINWQPYSLGQYRQPIKPAPETLYRVKVIGIAVVPVSCCRMLH